MNKAMNNNPVEDELDAIRIELYERTKNMSSEERIDYLRQLVAPIHKEFGITPISGKPISV